MTIWMKSLEKLEIENMDNLEKFADKMIRNNILTPDEVREMMGYSKKEEKK